MTAYSDSNRLQIRSSGRRLHLVERESGIVNSISFCQHISDFSHLAFKRLAVIASEPGSCCLNSRHKAPIIHKHIIIVSSEEATLHRGAIALIYVACLTDDRLNIQPLVSLYSSRIASNANQVLHISDNLHLAYITLSFVTPPAV